MIIVNADDRNPPSSFEYYVTSATGQELRGPLQAGHYRIVQVAAIGPAPYTVFFDASDSYKAEGIQSPDACVIYCPALSKNGLVATESR
jgi:hypothetical protein